MLLCKESAIVLDAVWHRKQLLRSRRNDFVANRLTTDRILLIKVLHLERPAIDRIVVQTLRGRNRSFADLITISVRVCLRVDLHWQTLLVDDSVLMAIDGWIYSQAETMLMVLRKNTWANDITPICCLAFVNVDRRHDTCGSSFDNNVACLTELEREDILVVGLEVRGQHVSLCDGRVWAE